MTTFFKNTHIFVINLKDNIDRFNHIKNEFNGYNNLHIIDAVDGRDRIKFLRDYEIQYAPTNNWSDPLIALICSHAKSIYTAYSLGLDYACIFEDDVHLELINKCSFSFQDILNKEPEWEIIQLYYITDLIEYNSNFLNNGINILPRIKNYSGSCYVINRKGMEKFLNNIVRIENNELTKYTIIPEFIDIEDLIFGNLNAFIINRPFVYYYFETMSFNSYIKSELMNNTPSGKELSQSVQKDAKNLLISLY